MSLQRLYQIFWEYRDAFITGTWVTIVLSLIAIVLALAIGLLACVGTLAKSRLIRTPAILYVEFCRNTPILVQLVWVHYAWPEFIGVKFNAFTSSVIALALQSSGYLAEEYRAGIESIERGQIEAAQSLGMTYGRLMRRIVVPQAVMRMIPGILNQFVTCFKSTSIVSVIAVPDLMYQAGLIVSATFLPMQVYTFIAVQYFLMVLVVSLTVRHLTARLPQVGAQHVRRAQE
ncbi:MAG: amino acid ABC transporter permease [Alphaproteobacteria bacterium]|nr:amino acid ABC transporter permease [Alphaproteobacteria bacterium]